MTADQISVSPTKALELIKTGSLRAMKVNGTGIQDEKRDRLDSEETSPANPDSGKLLVDTRRSHIAGMARPCPEGPSAHHILAR